MSKRGKYEGSSGKQIDYFPDDIMNVNKPQTIFSMIPQQDQSFK